MTIRRRKIAGVMYYDYPSPHYDAKKVKIGPIYEGGMAVKQIGEFILVGVADSDLAQFLQADEYEKDGFIYSAEETDVNTIKSIGDSFTSQTGTEKFSDRLTKIIAEEVK